MANIKLPQDVKGAVTITGYYSMAGTRRKLKSDDFSERVKWDSFSSIEMRFGVEYSLTRLVTGPHGQPETGGGVGEFGFYALWSATFTDSGLQLDQDGVQPRMFGNPKHLGGIVVAADAKISQGKAKSPFIEVVVKIVVSRADPGVNISAGFLGSGISRNVGAALESVASEASYRIKFDVEKQPKKKPDIPRDLLKRKAYFEKIAEYKVPSASLRTLDDWIGKIEKIEELHQVIVAGRLTIYLDGHTSKSGSKLFNADLAKKRIQSVERELNRRFGSSKVDYNKNPKTHLTIPQAQIPFIDTYFDT